MTTPDTATRLITPEEAAVLRIARVWHKHRTGSALRLLTNAVGNYLTAPTRGTESTQPAEQDPAAHTDATDAQELTQADRIIAIVAAAGLHLAYRDTNHTGKGRDGHLNAADVDEVVAEAIDQIKILTDGAVSIGSLAARKSDDLAERLDQGFLNLAGRVRSRHCEPGTDPEAYALADRVPDLFAELQTAQALREDAESRGATLREELASVRYRTGRLVIALHQLVNGRSDHDVVSVELLRRVLADGPGRVELVAELDDPRACEPRCPGCMNCPRSDDQT